MQPPRQMKLAVVTLCLHRTLAFSWAPQAPVRRLAGATAAGAPAAQGGCHAAPTGTWRKARRRRRVAVPHPTRLAAAAAPEAESTALTGSKRQQQQQQQRQPRKEGKGAYGANLQSVDFTTALLMSRELEQSIVPARVENAYQMDAHNVALQLRTLEGNIWLHVSWHPKGARCHVGGDVPREKEQKAYTFSQTLRSQIRGLNIVSVGLARPMERVVRLDLAPRLDTSATFRLYVEIMASRSNVVLVAVDEASGSETIAACAYQVSPSKSVRPLSTGQAYVLPPAMTARRRPRPEEPFEDFVEAVGRVPTQQLKKALVAVYQGLSPMLVTVMASRVAGLTAVTKVGEVSPEQWSALFYGPWKRWLRVIEDGGDTAAGAAAVADGAGADEDAAASNVPTKPWISEDGASYYPTTLGEEEGDDGGATDVAAAGQGGRSKVFSLARLEKVMEKYYRGTQSNEEFDGLKRRCLSRVTATLAKLRERAAEFEDQLAAAQEDKVSELNRRGDLLMTYGYAWEYGQTHVHCEDFDTGEPVSIEIPRDKTPIDVAQEAFKLGKKLKRSAAVVKELLDRANAQILYAEGIEMALEQLRGGNPGTASSREELSVLRGVAEELGILGGADAARSFASAFGVKQVQSGGTTNDGSGKRGGNRKGNKKGAAGGKKGKGGGGGTGGGGKKEAPTAGLLELRREPGAPAVLVGRNNQQNERITFSLARAHELWLHARGVAGAHVLLRLNPGQEAEDDDLAFAADVAAFFSKARQSASTPVDYISPKMVKKLGGGGPGMVKFDGAKVVRGEPGRVEAVVAEATRLREEAAR